MTLVWVVEVAAVVYVGARWAAIGGGERGVGGVEEAGRVCLFRVGRILASRVVVVGKKGGDGEMWDGRVRSTLLYWGYVLREGDDGGTGRALPGGGTVVHWRGRDGRERRRRGVIYLRSQGPAGVNV